LTDTEVPDYIKNLVSSGSKFNYKHSNNAEKLFLKCINNVKADICIS